MTRQLWVVDASALLATIKVEPGRSLSNRKMRFIFLVSEFHVYSVRNADGIH